MIAIDMDGTLLGLDGQVSARNLAALRAAETAGVEVVVATGRRHSYAMRVLRALGLHHANALVSSNGAVTRTIGSEEYGSALLDRALLPLATSRWMLEHLRGEGDANFRNALVLTFDRVVADGPAYGDDTRGALVVEHLEELHGSIGRWMQANEPYLLHIDPLEDALNADGEAPIQAMLCGTIDRMARAEARLRDHPLAAEHLEIHKTEYPARDLSILDILQVGCSKGAALARLAASRGLDPAQILAIGDNWNDVSMLEIAGRAVLMRNAPEDLQSLAAERGWRVGATHDRDGVADAIEAALTVAC
jgi:hydroxymethylpyrimidine pyrophosphatase-like HAD family hydrolase